MLVSERTLMCLSADVSSRKWNHGLVLLMLSIVPSANLVSVLRACSALFPRLSPCSEFCDVVQMKSTLRMLDSHAC